ncbi:class I SAM-dependent methyltransferase [Acidovorax sp. NCPPB 3859]|nr:MULTISPECIES: class I SAM-dependent methyltransferase [unclassified Acidovorax]MDA8453062.1 class I SAM-dependent methyltransferase [Acidovorax sp. GBBC 3297]MDA8462463.1 class I SAM-dependent methyltransferase [Acidovorax sp. GBBC 3333]MDA8467504.1 class I SAM-dependent methyltransferase [Acidovorax sp. GBBC 3332]MDA8472538.1 class I SAM-dependent methyltransferase [Acidovorax sp. GBBC 3299]WCM80349.1 class I SAM-dependent methyltransferase [Acidovorax sp. GBBC 712]
MLKRMTPKDYSDFWERESTQFANGDTYDQLCNIAPAEETLEVGCGSGWSTVSLAKSRHVLAIDNNDHLINLARRRLETHGVAANIIKSDLFEPSDEVIEAITAFQPKVIVGWFIGSHPDDNDKRTPANLRIDEKPKVYRENVEDRLVRLPLCPASVEWVHTVNRGAVPPGVSEGQIKDGVAEEYNKYMLSNSGFSVTAVHVLTWNQGTAFPYVQTPNPNLPPGKPKPAIISILARRIANP